MRTRFNLSIPDIGIPSTAGSWEIFLSATVRDLIPYRQAVKIGLGHAEIACFLSEEWSGGYDDTIQKCHDKLHSVNGYIGIFAYWYGSIPPGFNKSITHMEFHWAMQRWGKSTYPPIAVFMPNAGSKAETDLRKRARLLLAQEPKRHQDHAVLLNAFHNEVLNPVPWRTVRYFDDQDMLRDYAIIAVSTWRGGTPLNAATGAVTLSRTSVRGRWITDDDMMLLGRGRQIETVTQVCSHIAAHADVPAVGMIVSGDEDAGQRLFLRQLRSLRQFHRGRPPKVGRPLAEPYSLQALIQWIGVSLGVVPPGEGVDTPERLAELVGAELYKQQLCFILDHVNRMVGGIVAFHDTFWQPFYQRLKELRLPRVQGYPLIAVVVDYTGQTKSWPTHIYERQSRRSSLSSAKLLLLPKLTDFDANDVLVWLDELDVPDIPAGNRQRLVDIALTKPSGQRDGTPDRVFERLRREVLWSEEG
jgi:hypothetical protein